MPKTQKKSAVTLKVETADSHKGRQYRTAHVQNNYSGSRKKVQGKSLSNKQPSGSPNIKNSYSNPNLLPQGSSYQKKFQQKTAQNKQKEKKKIPESKSPLPRNQISKEKKHPQQKSQKMLDQNASKNILRHQDFALKKTVSPKKDGTQKKILQKHQKRQYNERVGNILDAIEQNISREPLIDYDKGMNKEEERPSFNKEEEGVQQQIKRIMFKIEFYKEKFSSAKQLQEDKSILANQVQNYKEEIASFEEKLTQQKKRVDDQIKRLREVAVNKQYSSFFYANILQDQPIFQEYLMKVLMKISGNFKSSRLIYLWNPINKTNIHQYIDSLSHIVFVIRTVDDYFISAYTEKPFKKNELQRGSGAIISLTNRRAITVKPNSFAIAYDAFCIRFGNFQLDIKGDQISSKLGAAGGCYQSGSEKPDILFGRCSKAVTKIAQLQVFQLMF